MGEMDTFDAIAAASALIGAIGCYWIMGSLMYHEVNIFQLTFGFCLIVPGLINMSDNKSKAQGEFSLVVVI